MLFGWLKYTARNLESNIKIPLFYKLFHTLNKWALIKCFCLNKLSRMNKKLASTSPKVIINLILKSYIPTNYQNITIMVNKTRQSIEKEYKIR